MQRILFVKLVVIAFLGVLLLIPLALIESKVRERSDYRDQVKRDIAASWTGSQKLLGPVLVFPYRVTSNIQVWDKNLEQYISKEKIRSYNKLLLPEEMQLHVKIDTDFRSRGIYQVPVYTSRIAINGRFDALNRLQLQDVRGKVEWKKPFLVVGVSDIRGLTSVLDIQVDGEHYAAESGSGLELIPDGYHVTLKPQELQKANNIDFAINMDLRGMNWFEVVPVGGKTDVTMTSSWPHPGFGGDFLPEQRQISGQGFTANWSISGLASSVSQSLTGCINKPKDCQHHRYVSLGVELVQPVDVYLKSERAVKYGILFVLLIFGVFFLFEILKNLRIHPIQYLLVGFALALFFQLLLSLTEHIAFINAYLVSAFASICLVTFYISFLLKSVGRSLGLGLLLSVVYAFLYMILKSEDYSLLMGSVLLFVFLAGFMFLTRRIDWYQLGGQLIDRGEKDEVKI